MQVDPGRFREAMGMLPTGVTVVSTSGGEVPYAMTANAVMSVSLEPVLMVFSANRRGRFYTAVMDAGVWGVSILPARARPLAKLFAMHGRPLPHEFESIPHHRGAQTGVPLLDSALATFECRTVGAYPAGDHTLVLGRVVALSCFDGPLPALTFWRGGFGQLDCATERGGESHEVG